MAKKTFVIDTNVLLSDPEALLSFEDNDIILPLIVIEELDRHKDRQDEVGRNARETVRKLSDLTKTHKDLKKGISLKNGGTLRILSVDDFLITNQKLPTELSNKDSGDNSIVSLCKTILASKTEDNKLVLVTRDTLLRLKCDIVGIECEDYKKAQVATSISSLYSGVKTIKGDFDIDFLYKEKCLDIYDAEITDWNLFPNQFLILENEQDGKTGLVRFIAKGEPLYLVDDVMKIGKLEAKNKEQRFALQLLLDPDVKLVTLAGPAGTGKAQPLDAKILTPDGWTTMSEIKVGSKVIGRNGNPIDVLGVFPQGEKDIYEIVFSDGSSSRSCLEHLWETSDEKERWIGKSSVKSLSEILLTLKGHDGRKNHSIPTVKEVCFTPKSVPFDPYALGVLLGDGCLSVSGRVHLSNADQELILKFSTKLPNADILRKNPNNKYDYNIKRKIRNNKPSDTCMAIAGLGLMRTKSHTKFIPDIYKYNDISTRQQILQGLVDTDGYIADSGTHAEFYTTSKQLAVDVKELVNSLSGFATINNKQTKYTYLNKIKDGKPSFVVRMSFGDNSSFCPASLSRKANRWKTKKSYKSCRFISDIRFVGRQQAQCIYVDDPDHLYVTDDYTLTHNTILSIAAGLELVLEKKKYKSLVVCRPIQPLGKDIGFLPGSLEEKLLPWIAPIKDNLRFLLSASGKRSRNVEETLEMYFDDGTIEVEAMTFIRGRSISNAFMVIDEAQNLNAHELKTILTRVGEGTKIVLTGDIEQIDNTYVDSLSNGLTVAIERFKDQEISGHVTLIKGERSILASLAARLLS